MQKYFTKDDFSALITNFDVDSSPEEVESIVSDNSLLSHMMENLQIISDVKVHTKGIDKNKNKYKNVGNIKFVRETGVYEVVNCDIEYDYSKYSPNAVYIAKQWCKKEINDIVIDMNKSLIRTTCDLVRNYLLCNYEVATLRYLDEKNIFKLKYAVDLYLKQQEQLKIKKRKLINMKIKIREKTNQRIKEIAKKMKKFEDKCTNYSDDISFERLEKNEK